MTGPTGRDRSARPESSLGAPLAVTDEQLDQLAEVTPVDQVLADALWKANAPKHLTDLLDAAPQ